MDALTSGEQSIVSKPYSDLLSQIEAVDSELANRAIVLDDGTLQLDSFQITPLGLIGGERASEAEWRKLGKTLFKLHDSLQIILGDWLVRGERVYGKTYEELAVEFDRKKKTLYNWKYVMSSVDISLRGEMLTFKHYRIVAAMDYEKQAYWLGLAIQNKWGAGKMQDEIDNEQLPALKGPTILKYSTDVMNKKDVFFARVERINRAFDGKDNPDQQAMWEYIQDIEAFVKAIRENFGWNEEL